MANFHLIQVYLNLNFSVIYTHIHCSSSPSPPYATLPFLIQSSYFLTHSLLIYYVHCLSWVGVEVSDGGASISLGDETNKEEKPPACQP